MSSAISKVETEQGSYVYYFTRDERIYIPDCHSHENGGLSKCIDEIVAEEEIRQITFVNVISENLVDSLRDFELVYQDIGKHENVRCLRGEWHL